MLAAAVTLTLFGFILTVTVDLLRRDGRKIIAALAGHSWAAEPTAGRPITIRFNRPNRAGALVRQRELRAVA